MKITIIAGARPNFMKIAPLIRAIQSAKDAGKNISARLVYTGKPDDTSLEPSLFTDLDMPHPDAYLNIDSDDFFQRMAGIIVAFSRELEHHPAHIVMVVDDLTPTMACSIVARKKGIKIAHLVAGVRSFDLDAPKEVNRLITDGLSDILFTAGMSANRNLNQSGTQQKQVHFVGNILIDTLRYNRNRLQRPIIFSILGLKEKDYLLLTLNRRSLLQDDKKLKDIFQTILANTDKRIIAPLHTYVKEKLYSIGIRDERLVILPPQPYLSFGYLVNHASAILTDSGNVAEEATFLGIPCITLNTYAEHQETITIGTNCLVGEDIDLMKENGKQENYQKDGTDELQNALYKHYWRNSNHNFVPIKMSGHSSFNG